LTSHAGERSRGQVGALQGIGAFRLKTPGRASPKILARFCELSKLRGEMAKTIVGNEVWAEMTEDQKLAAVITGRATPKQMSDGLLDGSERLRRACQDSLVRPAAAFENPAVEVQPQVATDISVIRDHTSSQPPPLIRKKNLKKPAARKQRFGLPENFVPRLQRYGRGVLLELNIYRLPNGQEFIPAHPLGTLGQRQHLYALLTVEQFLSGKRGSVYVRSDGRIFDYSADSLNPSADFFDTGYTIYDLERTGHYAPPPGKKRRKRSTPPLTRAHAG
jgi:hypothetical protein